MSEASATKKVPMEVAVTGAAGQIGYALLFKIASGDMFGPDQPVRLRLLERDDPKALAALRGVAMELEDGAFGLLAGVVETADPEVAFAGADFALLVGGRPRGPGQERRDVLKLNAEIYKAQGDAIGRVAKATAKVLVVGNPANTNCLVAMSAATAHGRQPASAFQALMRLDHNRALSRLAAKAGVEVGSIEGAFVWGNHSNAMRPDARFATTGGVPILDKIADPVWVESSFVPEVARRGTAIIEARGLSSAASAAHAAVEHARDWMLGSAKVVTVGMVSDGSYGIPEGLVFGFPVRCLGAGQCEIIQGYQIDAPTAAGMKASVDELQEERSAAMEVFTAPKSGPKM